MLEYNMTKNILLIAFLIFEFLHCFKIIRMFSICKQIKFNQFKLKTLRIVNFNFSVLNFIR